MQQRTTSQLLFSAALLGILSAALLRTIPWGLNALVWTGVFLIAATALIVRARPQPVAAVALAVLSSLTVAGGLVWRDAELLNVMDMLLLLPALALFCLSARGVRAWAAGMIEIGGAILYTVFHGISALLTLVFTDIEWGRAVRTNGRGSFTLLRGTLFAVPPLLVFGMLLASADQAFAQLLRNLVVFDLSDFAVNVIVALITATACAAFFRSILADAELPRISRESLPVLRASDLAVSLALINVLFAAFVAVQFRYLFGGAHHLRTVAGVTYADYARSGFFELVVVVALVVPLLLVVEWIASKDDTGALRRLRLFAAAQVALVLVIAASAYYRMRLYRDEFGLTEDRLYATVFMVWLAAVLVWLGVTVLTGHRRRFAIGALVTGVATVVALHAINPDALIVRTNLARAAAGKRAFDVEYALRLSDDATPALVAGLSQLPPAQREVALTRLRQRDAHRPIGWRSWKIAREQAHVAIARYESKATPPIGR